MSGHAGGIHSFLIDPPTLPRTAKSPASRELDATAAWAVTPKVMELSAADRERRRVIADRRRGEDVKAARRADDTDEVARLVAARTERRRTERRLSRRQQLKRAS